VLAEDLVVEALYAERELVALVLCGPDRVGGIRSVLDRRFRRRVGRDRGFGSGGLISLCLSPAPINDEGDRGGDPQQNDQDGCRNGDDESSRAPISKVRMIAGFRGN
jgi:hypothetical protein